MRSSLHYDLLPQLRSPVTILSFHNGWTHILKTKRGYRWGYWTNPYPDVCSMVPKYNNPALCLIGKSIWAVSREVKKGWKFLRIRPFSKILTKLSASLSRPKHLSIGLVFLPLIIWQLNGSGILIAYVLILSIFLGIRALLAERKLAANGVDIRTRLFSTKSITSGKQEKNSLTFVWLHCRVSCF